MDRLLRERPARERLLHVEPPPRAVPLAAEEADDLRREQVGVEVEDGEDGGLHGVTENGCDPGSPDPGSPSTNEPHVSMLSESEPSADPALK